MANCLLCNSDDIIEVGSVQVKEIAKKYLKIFNADITNLFSYHEIKLIQCRSCDLKFYSPLVPGDENFYAVLQQSENYYRKNKEEYIIAAKFITGGAKVLDVGCGSGEFRKFIPENDFVGLEFSREAIKTGTENGCKILNESIEVHAETNFEKYDFVTAFQVLEHVPDIFKFIDSCAKCIKPGGKLIIAVPSEDSYLQFSTNSILNMPPHHISRWTDHALINISKLINFKFIQLYHDELDPLHISSFFSVLVEKALRSKKNPAFKLIDNRLIYKVRNRLAITLASRLASSSTLPIWHGRGQNVTAVFEKPS
jgi:2-polyprenyl-3-methyl-5-hydroxy-6-metoxy-1,4-benzoquinol methylase